MRARRGDERLQTIAIADPHDDPSADSRIAPAMRLVRRFLDACERGGSLSPSLADGYRVQSLIDAARRAHASGRWIETASPAEDRP
jgi:predicted dehydrogenase